MSDNIQKQRNVNIDDIRAIINSDDNELDAFDSAGKFRAILNRGSLATINKFLKVLRSEIKNEMNNQVDDDVRFELSKDKLKSISDTITSTISEVIATGVNVSILEKLNTLNDDRNDLREQLEVAANDNVELVSEVENLEIIISERDTMVIGLNDTMTEREQAFNDEILSLNAELKSMKSAYELLIAKVNVDS